MRAYEQFQVYKDKKYPVATLIDFARDIKVETIDIRLIDKYYKFIKGEYDIVDFIDEMKRVSECDLKYPILIYRGFIMDGKHRVAKALLENKKTIKVKFLEDLPLSID